MTLLVLISLGACSSNQPEQVMSPVQYVDLARFMGSWHVLADVPTPFDKKATEPLEIYSLNDDGTVATTYSFIPEGKEERREMRAKGFVMDETNAVWGMQFVWPIKADYRVVYLDEDYGVTVIGRNKRDFVWILSREPTIDAERFEELLAFVENLGYDRSKLRIHLEFEELLSQAGG